MPTKQLFFYVRKPYFSSMIDFSDEYFMQEALKEANLAFEADEVPVGAVVVLNNKIIARGHNQVELLNDSTAHAEILALTSAYSAMGAKYLPEATLYVTLEPCMMCAGALYWGKISRIVYGASDEKNGYQKIAQPFGPKIEIVGGVLAGECSWLMKNFFKNKR